MFNSPPREREWVSWLWVTAWSLVIFATIPFARAIQQAVDTHWGREAFTEVVLATVVLAAGAALLHVARRHGCLPARQLLWLCVVGTAYAGFTVLLRANPEESLHFVEYGVLGVLLFRAFAHRTRDPAIYVAAAIAGAMIGTADEMIQWLTPRRVFEYRDINLNSWAGVLAQAGIVWGIRPAVIAWPVRAASVGRVCRLAAALILLLGLCLSNTPPVAEWISGRVPALAHLREKDPMSEYGHRYADPAIGLFYSRFSLVNLKATDTARAGEAAAILDEYRNPGDYGEFLRRYTPLTDPFVHEARVHLFRRDHYRSVLWKHRDNDRDHREHGTVAIRENQILEKYFGKTLGRSRQRLTPDEVDVLEKNLLADTVYESPVSAELITRFSLGQAWAVLLLGVVVLMGIPPYYRRKARI